MPAVVGVHALALVYAIAGTRAVVGVSSVVGPTVTGIHANALQPMLLLVPMHADAGVSAVVSPTVLLMAVLVFRSPMREKFSGLWKETFCEFPQVLLYGPEDFPGMGKCTVKGLFPVTRRLFRHGEK